MTNNREVDLKLRFSNVGHNCLMKYSADPSFLSKMFPPAPESRGHDCTFLFFFFFFGKDDRILGHMRKESEKNQGSA